MIVPTSRRDFRLKQVQLRKPVCSGTQALSTIAIFVNRVGPAADYEIRRKSSSGGQLI